MNLKIKFIIITLLSSLALTAIINVFYVYKTKESLYREFRNKSILLARNFSTLAKEALNNKDDILLFSYVDNMKKEENVLYSGILDNNKNVVAHSDYREIDKIYNDEEGIFFEDDILKIDNLIQTNSEEKYLSICGFSTEILKSDLNSLYTQLVIVSVIAISIPVFVLSFFTNKLQRNLNIIQDSIQLATGGVYKQEIKTERDEIEIFNITKSLIKLYEKIEKDSLNENIYQDTENIGRTKGREVKRDMSLETEIIKNLINSIKNAVLVTNSRNSILLSNNPATEILKQEKIEGKHILEICKENKELLSLFNESIKKKNEEVESKIKLNEKEYKVTIKTITKNEKETLGSIILFQ